MQKKWLIFIVAILIMGRVWAADSLVWQISRQNKTHGYLIGTMHTAPKNFRLPENMRLAMKNTKKLRLILQQI